MNRKNNPSKHKIFKIMGIVCLLSMIIIAQSGCSAKEPVSKSDYCLNTACTITLYDMEKTQAEQLLDAVYQQIRDDENLLSKTVKGSDVYKINHAKGEPVEVSEETAYVVNEGIAIGELSGGAFDITIGKVSDLWNFTGENPQVPDEQELAEALKTVDYTQIEWGTAAGDETRKTIRLKNPEAQLDLGGIAKGYIADRAAEYLQAHGVVKGTVNLGGNVVAIGEKAEDTPWNIGIERPFSDRTELIGSLQVTDATVVTSGIYERKFEQNGRLYHHVLDPKTGYPAESPLEAVTVTASRIDDLYTSGFCDGLSTTFLMLGTERSQEIIRRLNEENPQLHLEAAFIDKNDQMVQTEGMHVEQIED